MSVSDKVLKLAFQGEWDALLPILRDYPHLVNHPSEPKGYTPLHQTAWHGADLSVNLAANCLVDFSTFLMMFFLVIIGRCFAIFHGIISSLQI